MVWLSNEERLGRVSPVVWLERGSSTNRPKAGVPATVHPVNLLVVAVAVIIGVDPHQASHMAVAVNEARKSSSVITSGPAQHRPAGGCSLDGVSSRIRRTRSPPGCRRGCLTFLHLHPETDDRRRLLSASGQRDRVRTWAERFRRRYRLDPTRRGAGCCHPVPLTATYRASRTTCLFRPANL